MFKTSRAAEEHISLFPGFYTGTCLDKYKENKYISHATAVLPQLPKMWCKSSSHSQNNKLLVILS